MFIFVVVVVELLFTLGAGFGLATAFSKQKNEQTNEERIRETNALTWCSTVMLAAIGIKVIFL